jgi:hypothetical protein
MSCKHRLRLKEVPVEMRERAAASRRSRRLRSIYYMAKVLLAIFVGLFRRYAVPRGGTQMTPLPVSIAARSRRSCCSSSSSS